MIGHQSEIDNWASPQDFDLIGTEFHRWVRDHEKRLGLLNSIEFARVIENDFAFYSRWHEHPLDESHLNGLVACCASELPQPRLGSARYFEGRGRSRCSGHRRHASLLPMGSPIRSLASSPSGAGDALSQTCRRSRALTSLVHNRTVHVHLASLTDRHRGRALAAARF
jgi:hypothetical protein